MPKKTRREKIIADYRKKLNRILEAPSQQSVSPYQITNQHASKQNLADHLTLDATELSAIKRNIAKTVLLAGLAVAGEIALYWFWK